ncbi:conserved Plasmodium protein, unknown function [Plasmodium knowlesi strain H]|uniref:Uncharacterized protein n=3 Tax=Plasmodium knowlesi TaxID=5850 RepID=A0A5K1V1A9_PLAKH|nr:conserved Plasmodium protein, unknown function [Plasmodium knowlesi strain H]OTN66781.1 Uncharacterized protein PKNOH_S08482100 [Plasmodium knowlesi]CAA9990145.1 conserved Plasmodium protein, unknown function [Plasmodium knowlesi strain H]SBO25833.1 conserved Plasmodium protein, unknown function [Plasmodium knowlesi strain H]SBO28618.1 conserved Plasmodium protein, unknown function [Plasmodium knowlesi strain H]VVS79619.1 conserved Plasmodium protein, unknown function [Plasmodium knowlesi s|eukprot:XP_002260612.1 hypothetical protein, conserved in Plasmodium species [Plasmodium knowlesi strain H]
MLSLHKIKRVSNAHRLLLTEERNKIHVVIHEHENFLPKNNSKTCRNKYKNVGNLHRIIHSGVLKGHKNVYFYKCLLRIAEKRRNDLTLHQINIILKALLRGKIYRYVSFHSFEMPILNHLNLLKGLINHVEEGSFRGRGKTQQSRNESIRISHTDQAKGKEADNYNKFLLNEKIRILEKHQPIEGDPSKVKEIISDQFDILVDIFKSYLKIMNFHFCFFSRTIFFFIVKNCQYLPHGQNLMSIWGMYVKRVLSIRGGMNPKEGCPLQIGRNHEPIGGDSSAYIFIPPVREPKLEESRIVNLYRYKYHQNIYAKTVRNYTVAFKNEKRKKGGGKKEHPCNPLFCKNGNLPLCKYMVMLILKQDKLATYWKRLKQKKTHYKNAYLSNGYLYKMKNTNMVLDFQSKKYLIKVGFVHNRALLQGEGLQNDLAANGHFVRCVSNWMSKLKVRCRLLSAGIKPD